MSSLFALRVVLMAGEAILASSALMMLAWLGATQPNASRRHLVWCAAFGALLALPLLTTFAPSLVRLPIAAPEIPAAMPTTVDLSAMDYVPPPAPSFFD